MAARSIASLSLSFGLVSIPVKLYPATESSATIRFNLLTKDGERVRQQYVSARDERVLDRSELIKGYEFEKDHFVTFTPEELKALQESPSHTIDIVAFIPGDAVDPIYYDKAYYLAPDRRGAKPYSLLVKAMRESGRCALAKWAWKGRQYVVQVRPSEDGMVLQQLLYADEVRSLKDLDIEKVPVTDAELKLALKLIEQISTDRYDPKEFEDEEKKRILAAIDGKIAGRRITVHEEPAPAGGAQVIDLMAALRASLGAKSAPEAKEPAAQRGERVPAAAARTRKAPRRAASQEEPAGARTRARSKK